MRFPPRRPVLAVALFLLPLVVAGQAWTQSPGEGLVRASVGFASADSWLDHEGVQQPLDPRISDASLPYRDRPIRLYAEYGLIENLTVVGSIRLLTTRLPDGVEEPAIERSTTDLADARLGFRLGLVERLGVGDRFAVSAGLDVQLPLGYHRNTVPNVGDGQIDVDLVAGMGYSFEPIPVRAEVNVGYRFRSQMYGLSRMQQCGSVESGEEEPLCLPDLPQQNFSDELIARVDVGYTAVERFSVDLGLGTVWSIERPEPVATPGGIVHPHAFTQRRLIYAGAGAGVLLFGGASLFAEASTSLYGQNVLRAPRVRLGIESRF